MIKRNVSIILFYDDYGNILLQDRKDIRKHNEEYGFFGGKIEENETPEEALKREIKEELGIDLEKISNKLFGAQKDTEAWGKNSEGVAKFIKMIEEQGFKHPEDFHDKPYKFFDYLFMMTFQKNEKDRI